MSRAPALLVIFVTTAPLVKGPVPADYTIRRWLGDF